MRLSLLLTMGVLLSACVSNQPTEQTVQWDQISGSNTVAKVSGIKSLMQPGFY